MKNLIFSSVLSLAASALADNEYTWSSSADDPDNILTNAVHFSPALGESGVGGIHAAETVQFRQDGDLTVRVPAGLDFASCISPYFKALSGGTFTLDATSAAWRQIDVDSSNEYPNSINPSRFRIGFGDNYAMSFRNSDKTKGAFRIDGGRLVVSNRVGGASRCGIGFSGGLFDFFSPNGTDCTGGDFLVTGSSSADVMGWTVSDGASLRLPKIYLYEGSSTNEWNFLSGENYIHSLQLRGFAGADDDYVRTRINVRGEDTSLMIREIGHYIPEGGSETAVQGCRFLFADGATMRFSGADDTFGDGLIKRGLLDVVFDGGKLDVGVTTLDWENMNVAATNAVFSTHKITVRNGSFLLKDTVWTSDNRVTFGYNNCGDTLCEIDGGTYSFASLYVGQKAGTHIFAVSNGSVTVSCEKDASYGLGIGGPGSASYASPDASGKFYISGGSLTVGTSASHPLSIGGIGDGCFEISGGRLDARSVKFFNGSADANGKTAEYRQSGGEAHVAGDMNLVSRSGTKDCSSLVLLEGGTLTVGGIVGGEGCSAVNPAKTSVARLVGNGGTLRAGKENPAFISGLNAVACGERALVIESDFNIATAQPFTDDVGARGKLILTGSGEKTLSATSTDVSEIVAAEGTVVFAPGAKAASHLIVSNGAKALFGDDPADIGFTGLSIGGDDSAGIIELSVSSTVALGNVSQLDFKNIIVDLTGECAPGSTYTLAEANGSASEALKAQWSNAVIRNCENEILSYEFTTTEQDGVTRFNVVVAEAARIVTVSEGENLTVDSAIAIGGNAALLAEVASNATMTISAGFTGGVIVKRGPGRLVIGGRANVIRRGVVCGEGIVTVNDVAALSGASALFITGGTFEFADGEEEQTLPCPLVCRAPLTDKGIPGIIDLKIESPLTITEVVMESGCIFKRGVGRLTFAPAPGETMILSMHDGTRDGNGTSKPRNIGDISSDHWQHPTTGYSGFNVAEGEVLVCGDSSSTVRIDHWTLVPTGAHGLRAPASLVFDGVKGTLAGNGQFSLGCYSDLAGGYCIASKTPRLEIRNGADVSTRMMKVLEEGAYMQPTSVVDSAVWRFSSNITPYGHSSPYSRAAFLFLNGARGYLGGSTAINAYGNGDAGFYATDSILAKNEALDGFVLQLNQKATKGGGWLLGENSTVALSAIKYTTNSGPMKVEMDGGTWLAAQNTLRLHNSWNISLETLRDEGVNFPVGAGRTNYIARAICGAGGVVKTGAGVLRFEAQAEWERADSSPRGIISNLTDSVSLAFDGPLDVREGTVLVDEGCCRTGGAYRTGEGAVVDFGGNDLGSGVTFSGAGTFTGADVGDCTISVSTQSVLAPVFDEVAFKGHIRVRFDEVTDNVEALTVAKFTGGAPDLSIFRSSRIGKSFRARFYVDGDSVKADVYKSGVMLIVR